MQYKIGFRQFDLITQNNPPFFVLDGNGKVLPINRVLACTMCNHEVSQDELEKKADELLKCAMQDDDRSLGDGLISCKVCGTTEMKSI